MRALTLLAVASGIVLASALLVLAIDGGIWDLIVYGGGAGWLLFAGARLL